MIESNFKKDIFVSDENYEKNNLVVELFIGFIDSCQQ